VTPRPLLAQFLEGKQAGNQGQEGKGEGFTNYLWKYQNFGKEFHAAMSL
jgi:hypothetical protein